jgi:hypothetical protein
VKFEANIDAVILRQSVPKRLLASRVDMERREVRTVANEGASQSRAFSWKRKLHGATEAGCCCGGFFGPAVVGAACKGDVRLRSVGSGGHW